MTEEQYLAAIDTEAKRVGFINEGESLVGLTGPDPWLQAWHEDPSLTPKDQVQSEIDAARDSA